jgi:hypothetical protein
MKKRRAKSRAPAIPPKAKMGRPRKVPGELDWKLIALAAQHGADQLEICEAFGISEDTILRRCQEKWGLTFAEWKRTKSAEGKALIRKAIFQRGVVDGDVTALIWLSKNLLSWTDKQSATVNHTGEVQHLLLTPEQKRALAEQAQLVHAEALQELTEGDSIACLPPLSPGPGFNPDTPTPQGS